MSIKIDTTETAAVDETAAPTQPQPSRTIDDFLPPPQGGLVGKREVAAFFHCSKRSVDNLIAQGMPHLKLSPRAVRFDLVDVLAWAKGRFGTRRAA